MYELDVFNDKGTTKTIKDVFPMFELLSLSTERFGELKGNFLSDQTLFKQIFNVWFHIILFEKDFEAQAKQQLKIFAFFTPNLIETSNKAVSNQIIVNDLASNVKVTEKYQRNFKHLLREQYPEQRPYLFYEYYKNFIFICTHIIIYHYVEK